MKHLSASFSLRTSLIVVMICWGASVSAGEMSLDGLPGSPAFKIAQYADVAAASGMVVIAGGSADGILDGATFESYRLTSGQPGTFVPARKPIWIKTGELKSIQIFERHTIAALTLSGTPIAKAFFPKYPGVMAGDVVIEKRLAIDQNLAVTPQAELKYRELFQDPNATAVNLELSSAGREHLREAAAAFAGKRVGMLVVEGHTDQIGPSDRNQVESYQRAMAVRQTLINEFGFDENRVTAIGLGETEPLEESYVPGFRTTNRRIVIKVIN